MARPFDNSTPEGRSKERYRRITLTVLTGFLARGAVALAGLVTVPIALSYLGKERYGLWMAIALLPTWMSLLDFGMSRGLVNVLSESHGKDDREAAATFVSTAFFALAGTSILFATLSAVALPMIDWKMVFAVRGEIQYNLLFWSVAAAAWTFLAGLPLIMVRHIHAGYQTAYVNNLFDILGALASLGGLLLAIHWRASLPIMILAFNGGGLVATLGNLIYLFKVGMPWLRPRWSSVSHPALKRLAGISLPIFIFQIGALMVNEVQLILLAHRCGYNTVTDYSIVTRLYLLVVGLITLSTSSFLPPFREATERGDHRWVQRSFRRMLVLRMALATVFSSMMVLTGDRLLQFWLRRQDIHFDLLVWAALAVLMIAATWVTSFTDFLTIMDKVWSQVGMVALNGLCVITGTYWLASRFGVLGAIVATAFASLVFLSWLAPWTAYRSAPEAVFPERR